MDGLTRVARILRHVHLLRFFVATLMGMGSALLLWEGSSIVRLGAHLPGTSAIRDSLQKIT